MSKGKFLARLALALAAAVLFCAAGLGTASADCYQLGTASDDAAASGDNPSGGMGESSGTETIEVQGAIPDGFEAENTRSQAEQIYERFKMPMLYLAAASLVLGAISYMFARGDGEKAERARLGIGAAVAGFLIGTCCFGLINLVNSLVV